MTEAQWGDITYFSPEESWGDSEKMDFRLIWLLDKLRAVIGKPFVIHCGYEKEGHAPNSFHYKGQAVDFHVRADMLFSDLYQVVGQAWWMGGMGIYPEWNSPGFHLDLGPYRRWIYSSDNYLSYEEGILK